MATSLTTNYGLTKVREMSPDTKDWAATDGNFEAISLLLKALEQHQHNGATPIKYPGYNIGTPTSPTLAILTEQATGGILTPGTTVGVRLAYQIANGLETDASPEVSLDIAAAISKPNAPTLSTTTVASPGYAGGTYIYVITKKKGSGETIASDILPVSIPYDNTYSITLAFEAINSYTDSTTALNIYRANGLNAPFMLVTTITSVSQTTYVDNSTIAPGNEQISPPTTTTFDAARKVRVNWAALSHPAGATKLRVYVTQQTGIWGNNCLLIDYDLPGAPTFVDYLGAESLGQGSPYTQSQLPTSPPKLDLSTEATGAPTLTANMNFAGFQAQNLKLHNNAGAPASPTNGYLYYDSSIPTVRAYINGAWVNWGTTAATAYTHPAEEAGGHLAANIKFVTAGTTLKTILDRTNTSTGAAKQVQTVVKSTAVTNSPTTSATAMSTSVFPAEMSITSSVPTFDNQWMEVYFNCQMALSLVGMKLNYCLEIGGVTQQPRTVHALIANHVIPIEFTEMIQLGTVAAGAKTVKVLWWVSAGTATAVNLQRSLAARLVY